MHFFNMHFERGMGWYESHFDDWSGQTAVGEATPGYIYHPDAPGRIKATLGDVKLIASLRNPVDRAYSAFWHHLRQGAIPSNADFRVFYQTDQWSICGRGYYYAQLSRYLEYFPFDNLLVLIYEELSSDGQRAVGNCLEFLGLDSGFLPNVLNSRVNRGGRGISVFHSQTWRMRLALRKALLRAVDVNLLPPGLGKAILRFGRRGFEKLAFEFGPKQRQYIPLAEDVRQELLNDYMSDIRRLESLLDRDLSVWYASPDT